MALSGGAWLGWGCLLFSVLDLLFTGSTVHAHFEFRGLSVWLHGLISPPWPDLNFSVAPQLSKKYSCCNGAERPQRVPSANDKSLATISNICVSCQSQPALPASSIVTLENPIWSPSSQVQGGNNRHGSCGPVRRSRLVCEGVIRHSETPLSMNTSMYAHTHTNICMCVCHSFKVRTRRYRESRRLVQVLSESRTALRK